MENSREKARAMMEATAPREYTLPEFAKAYGIKAADYPEFVERVIASVNKGELELSRMEYGGWSIPVVRRKRR